MITSLRSIIKDPLELMLFNMGVPYNYIKKTTSDFKGGKRLVDNIHKILVQSKGMFIYGPPGSGKTHLLASCMREIIINAKEEVNGLHAKFRSVPEMYLEIKSTFSRDLDLTTNQLVEKYSFLPYLFLDDLGAERITDFTVEILYIILNNRIANSEGGLRTFITSNYDLEQLQNKMDDRIASRIAEHCEIIKISKPDYRVKK